MKKGLPADQVRIKQKIEKYKLDPKEQYRDLEAIGYHTQTNIPEYAKAKNHLPVPPELIPELSLLGVTSESTSIPGSKRPDVDLGNN